MKTILLATDSSSIFADIDSALASENISVLRVKAGSDVLGAVKDHNPDVVLLDMQIGNMGGIACCLELRQEEGAQRLEPRPIGLLLDREADNFLAQQVKADGWLQKPLTSLRLRNFFKELSGVSFN